MGRVPQTRTDAANFLLASGATALFLAAALHEERHNVRRLGDDYVTYTERTKRFVPYVF